MRRDEDDGDRKPGGFATLLLRIAVRLQSVMSRCQPQIPWSQPFNPDANGMQGLL